LAKKSHQVARFAGCEALAAALLPIRAMQTLTEKMNYTKSWKVNYTKSKI